MKKLQKLIELKRQLGLLDIKLKRAAARRVNLLAERRKVVASFTDEEKRLYKDRIERACK